MFQKICVLAGLLSLAAVALSGCTPAVQSDEVTTDSGAWSNVTTSPGADAVDVQIVPRSRTPRRRWAPANVTASVPLRRAAPKEKAAAERVSRLETQLERLHKQVARMQQELDRMREQRK